MYSWVWHQKSLKLLEICKQSSTKSQGSGTCRNNLGNDFIYRFERIRLEAKPLADVMNRFVSEHYRAVGVLQHAVSGVHDVVGLKDRCFLGWSLKDCEL